MAEFAPKPPELVQAQIATYAAENINVLRDDSYINKNIGSLAVDEVHDVTRTLGDAEYIKNPVNGTSDRIEAGTERLVATGQDYTGWLRKVGGAGYEPIRQRAQLLNNYQAFKPEVDKLRESAGLLVSKKDHPDHLGAGSSSSAFRLEHEGKGYAVRLSNTKGRTSINVESYVRGAIRAERIPHLEHVVAMSYEDGVTIAEIMPGHDMKHVTAEEVKQVTDEQLNTLVDTLLAAYEAKIVVDPKPSNYFYDPKEGFGIIDLSYAEHPDGAPQSTADNLIGSVVALCNAGVYGFRPRTAEDYAHQKNQVMAIIPVIERYDAILQRRFSGDTLAKTEEHLQHRLNSMHDWLSNLSDPEWVNGQVQANMEREEQWRQAAEARKAAGSNNDKVTINGGDFV